MSTTRQLSPTTPPDEGAPPAKRVKLSPPPAIIPTEESSAKVEWKPSRLPYDKGLHLAPMVRIGTLPTRLASLEYGAELVWGPEIVDKAIIGTTRVVDPITGTVRFMKSDKSIFECHPLEKPRLIFQLGSADPVLAAQAAKIVADDVAGIGLNCGCPKPFSISGGMGAALLKTPEKLCGILRSLVSAVSVPIDVKIRLLSTQPATLDLVSSLIDTGVSALTVHCRTQEMRSSEPAILGRLKEIVDLVKEKKGRDFPVISNGDCFSSVDRERIQEITGVSSIMIARGAEQNASCFRPEGYLDPITVVLPHYVQIAHATGNNVSNAKYVLNTAYLQNSPTPPSKATRSEFKQKLNKAKTYEEFFDLFGVKEEDRQTKLENLVPAWVKRVAEMKK